MFIFSNERDVVVSLLGLVHSQSRLFAITATITATATNTTTSLATFPLPEIMAMTSVVITTSSPAARISTVIVSWV